MPQINRSFIKWPGSKAQCIRHIQQALPLKSKLIEPFVGSGTVFLNTNYNDYILSEVNPDIIGLFKVLQAEGNRFIDYCKTFFTPINNSKEQYYLLRDKFNNCNDPRLRSALFLYLNRHGYNGLCRYNSSLKYNVPFGSYVKPYFPQKEMENFFQKSQRAHFICQDFRKAFSLAQRGDVIYCDPPYVPLSKTAKFTTYYAQSFTEQDQLDLLTLAKDYANAGICVVVSNHDTDFTRRHYTKCTIKTFTVRRYISCANRKLANEILAIFGG